MSQSQDLGAPVAAGSAATGEAAAARPLLEINNIEVIYDEVILVLRGLSMDVPEGEIDWWAEHNDPISRYERYLADSTILSPDEMDSKAKELKNFLDAEADWAEGQPQPVPESAAYEVFDNSVVPPAFKKKVLER